MESIIIENFRCFKKAQTVHLKPLTLLVGENSTGKTSLLAAIRITNETHFLFPGEFDFNKDPYLLGAYNEIASYSGGRSGRADYFVLGKDILFANNLTLRVLFRFIRYKGMPQLAKITVKQIPGDNCLDVIVADEYMELSYSDGIKTKNQEIPYNIFYLIRLFAQHFKLKELESGAELVRRVRVYSSAPVRSAPQRSNDPKQGLRGPQGDQIPQLLREIYGEKDKNMSTINELESFGRDSGLFKSLGVTSYGGVTGPFRINVKISGSQRNILDVGYGVSQVLPIIVEASQYRAGLFLLQQPEIHLHPRAQAELGTYFGKQVKTTKKRFVVETHSDYLLDRIRFDIRDNVNGLSPDDVKLLFFHRKQNQPWVNIYEIDIDKNGELINPPDHYREFFTHEQMRLFNIKE
jgi:predicted ATPase